MSLEIQISLPLLHNSTYDLVQTHLVAQAHELKNYYNNLKLFERLLEDFFTTFQTRLDRTSEWVNDQKKPIITKIIPETILAIILNDLHNFLRKENPTLEVAWELINLVDLRIKKFLENYLDASTYQNSLLYNYGNKSNLCEYLLGAESYQSLEYLLRHKDIQLSNNHLYDKLSDIKYKYRIRSNDLSQSKLNFLQFLDEILPDSSQVMIYKTDQFYILQDENKKLKDQNQNLKKAIQELNRENLKLVEEYQNIEEQVNLLSL